MKDIISAAEMDLSRENDGYEELLEGIRRSFKACVNEGGETLFTTNATDLYDIILSALPAEASRPCGASSRPLFSQKRLRRFGSKWTTQRYPECLSRLRADSGTRERDLGRTWR